MATSWTDFWADWCQRYSAVFRLTREEDAAMLAAWATEFHASGFSQDELTAALDYLCRDCAEPTRWNHYQAVIAFVRQRRRDELAARLKAQPPADGDRGVCDLCGETGQVSGLPMPRDVHDGQWEGAETCAVLCRCSRGRTLGLARESAPKFSEKPDALRKRILLTIGDYERVNPYWRDQLAARKQQRTARRRSEYHTRLADRMGLAKPLAAVVQRLQQPAALPAKSEANGDEAIPF